MTGRVEPELWVGFRPGRAAKAIQAEFASRVTLTSGVAGRAGAVTSTTSGAIRVDWYAFGPDHPYLR